MIHTHISTSNFSLLSANKAASHTPVYVCVMQLSHTHTGEGVIILSCGFAHTTEEILRNQASAYNTSKTTFTQACKQAKKTPWCKHVQRRKLLVKKNPREKKKSRVGDLSLYRLILHLPATQTHTFGQQ